MDSNNEPPKKPAKAKTSKPRTSKAKSNAPIEPVQPDAGIPMSANSPNLVPSPGQWNGVLNTEVCSTQPPQADLEANSPKFVPASQVEEKTPSPKEQTQEAEILESPRLDGQDGQSSTPTGTDNNEKNTGNVPNPVSSVSGVPGEELLESASRAKQPGEKKHEYWERMRKSARLAGLPRGQGYGTAYQWATEQTDREFPPPKPVIVEELPDDSELKPAEPASVSHPSEAVSQKTGEETAKAAPVADLGVVGLGEIPESWPELPANAQLQTEIAWVTANRLKVRSGNGVDLARALSPAPSYSALSWLETSILFPSKFADISVKATADQDDEKEEIRREKLAIEEIRSILKEMLEAK